MTMLQSATSECVEALLRLRKTKGQQLKGKIVSDFSHFFIIFHTFSSFSLQDFPLQNKGFLAQGEQKRRKENKKNRANRCCTFVLLLAKAVICSASLYVKMRVFTVDGRFLYDLKTRAAH